LSPATNNIITSIATQTGPGVDTFTPTWTVTPGSVIAGFLPSAVGAGNFSRDAGSGNTSILTDGQFGVINPPGGASPGLVTAGTGGGGNSATYTLTNSASGYELTNIVISGGWSDAGRDQQHYTISYSTVANPTNFVALASVNYNPTLPGTVQSAVRATLSAASVTPLASSVARVKVDFTVPTGENGYSGYGEISLFGVASPPSAPTVNRPTVVGGNLILTGSGGTPNSGYTWLTSTNVGAPLATWTTNTTGVFSGTGTFSNAIPVITSELERFFRLRIP